MQVEGPMTYEANFACSIVQLLRYLLLPLFEVGQINYENLPGDLAVPAARHIELCYRRYSSDRNQSSNDKRAASCRTWVKTAELVRAITDLAFLVSSPEARATSDAPRACGTCPNLMRCSAPALFFAETIFVQSRLATTCPLEDQISSGKRARLYLHVRGHATQPHRCRVDHAAAFGQHDLHTEGHIRKQLPHLPSMIKCRTPGVGSAS